MKIIRTICAICVGALPLGALAEITVYAGLGVGGARLEEDLNVSVRVTDQCAVGVDCDPTYSFPEDGGPFNFQGTDFGGRLFAGVRLFDFLGFNIGLEGGYVEFGQPEDTLNFSIPFGPIGCNPAQGFSCTRPQTSRAITYEDEIDGWELYAIAGWPATENLEVFGKFGMLDWESSFTFTNKGDVFPPQLPFIEEVVLTPSAPVDTDGTDFAGGVGINYRISERVKLRAEGTWYAIEDVDMLYLIGGGFTYDF
jgi:opacity protein-like surface antigen